MNLRLYKYYRYSKRLLEILATKSLWLSKPSQFNDPFDGKFYIPPSTSERETEEDIKALLERVPKYRDTKLTESEKANWQGNDEMIAKKIKRQLSGVGIFSMSGTWESILMWSHYADGHRGVCLEFEVDRAAPEGVHLQAVTYTSAYPEFSTRDFPTDTEKFMAAFLTKSPEWEYEREWRLTSLEGEKLIPWPFTLRAVIFGHRLLEQPRSTIRAVLRGDVGIRFFEAKPCDREYKMIKEAVQ